MDFTQYTNEELEQLENDFVWKGDYDLAIEVINELNKRK